MKRMFVALLPHDHDNPATFLAHVLCERVDVISGYQLVNSLSNSSSISIQAQGMSEEKC